MRILWVKAGKILPVDTGGKIRSFNLLRHLAARQETILLSYYGGPRDESYEEELRGRLPGAVAVNTAAPDSGGARQGIDYLRRLPSNAPYAVTKFTAPAVRRLVSEWMAGARFDVAVCDFLSASLNFPRVLPIPTVLFQHNVESALWQRQAAHEPHPVKRLVFKLEAAKMRRYEQAAVRKFHHVIAVSEHDRDLMAQMTDSARISVVPTGVDLSHYRAPAGATNEQKGGDPVVMFLGSMDWEANIDGVDYFCAEIWPRIKSEVPNAKFQIVGRNPHPKILKLASESVEVTGGVPSVVEYLRAATVFVVPLRIGGGTRLKIFEAMATGRAVVSTSVGAEGLDVHHGEDILLEDTAEGFARGVVSLLRDENLRARLGGAAAALAARYDWSVIATRFENILAEVKGQFAPATEKDARAVTVNA